MQNCAEYLRYNPIIRETAARAEQMLSIESVSGRFFPPLMNYSFLPQTDDINAALPYF
jgi:hypothetical protein